MKAKRVEVTVLWLSNQNITTMAMSAGTLGYVWGYVGCSGVRLGWCVLVVLSTSSGEVGVQWES